MLIFAHIPKAAGSWINFILRCNFGFRHCMNFIPSVGQLYFDSEDLRFAEQIFPELNSISTHYIWDPARWLPNQHSCFSFLREPVARTASTYQYKVVHDLFKDSQNAGTKEHFAKWISDSRNQNYQIRQISGCLDPDRAKDVVTQNFFFLGLTEHLNESVKALSLLSSLPLNAKPPIPKGKKSESLLNRAADNSISKMLLEDPETRQLLESGNRFDTAFYQWVVAEKYPKYLAQAAQVDRRPTPAISAANYRRSKFFNNVVYASAQRLRHTFKGQKAVSGPGF